MAGQLARRIAALEGAASRARRPVPPPRRAESTLAGLLGDQWPTFTSEVNEATAALPHCRAVAGRSAS